jgi:hypothetical protein
MPGLVSDSAARGGPATQEGAGTTEYTTTADSRSHLDSFVDGSGWTREDLQLALRALQVALLVVLVLEEFTGGT